MFGLICANKKVLVKILLHPQILDHIFQNCAKKKQYDISGSIPIENYPLLKLIKR
jgi:hypothetical protein